MTVAGSKRSKPGDKLEQYGRKRDFDVTPELVTVTVDGGTPTAVTVDSSQGVRTSAGGFSLFAYRQVADSPSLTFDNLVIQ